MKSFNFLFPWQLILCYALLSGCATKQRGAYVIVGMDYGEVESMVAMKENAKIYIRDVARNIAGDKLIIYFKRLDGDKSTMIALVGKNVEIMEPNALRENAQPKPSEGLSAVARLPWVNTFYDAHPDTGQLLIHENRGFMARSYEYDLETNSRRKVGFAREWMFYLRRDFAKVMPVLKSFYSFKEPSHFRESASR